jgi:hypothetical protein
VSGALPLYLSPSQISSLLTCGEQYRLTRIEKVPERPQWASIGGSAVHTMTEDIDRALYLGVDITDDDSFSWDFYWEQALDNEKTRNPEFDPSEYRASGRASKANPNKEDPAWWAVNGPKFVASWVNWRTASGLTFAEVPNEGGELIPAIEIEVWAYGPNDEQVRSIIDRVMLDKYGHWYIIDIKSGSFTPAWPQQLLLNSLGLRQTYDNFPKEHGYVGFWKARDGGVKKWVSTADHPDEWLWGQVSNAKLMRDNGLFVAQPTNLCDTACGVSSYCVAKSGKSALEKLASRRTVQP